MVKLIQINDYTQRYEKIKALIQEKTVKKLQLHYSDDIVTSVNSVLLKKLNSSSYSLEIFLLDITWQISGEIPTEIELAELFFPIKLFFIGTVYQDKLLDSPSSVKPKELVTTLGANNCLLFGNILYCDAIIFLIENLAPLGIKIEQKEIIEFLNKLVSNVMSTEINRRNNIGKILSLEEFFTIWRKLNPYIYFIKLGCLLGGSETFASKVLLKIAENIMIVSRINKEISETYGLLGDLNEKLKVKPPPLPITLAYESANPEEKKELEKAVQELSTNVVKSTSSNEMEEEPIKVLVKYISKYNAIVEALHIHQELIQKTEEFATQISNPNHHKLLNKFIDSMKIINHK